MRSSQVWSDNVTEKGNPVCVHDMVYRPDGEVLFVACGSRLNVCGAADGKLVQTLRGHKDTIYSVSCSREGDTVVTGGADKQVIIWSGKPYEGQLKYPHNEAIQKVAHSPVASQILSCTNSDIGLWTPEQKSVSKSKVSSRVCDCSWTNDGQYFALGHFDGSITIWNKSGDEIHKAKIARPGGHPVWAVKWSPVREDKYDILAVCDWGQKMAFYQLNGKQIGKDRSIDFDVTCMKYFCTGDFKLVTGTNNKATVYSFDGIQLGVVCETTGWTWSCCVRPDRNVNQVAVGTETGEVAVYQLVFTTVHGMYQDKYAYRDQMTAVVVQQLLSNRNTRIRCHDLVKKIAIYKNKLAVQLTDKINVYEVADSELDELKYVMQSRFPFKEDCNLLVMTNCHVVMCQERDLRCLTLNGEPVREWTLDSQIRYIRVVSGPIGKESMLVGLRNGQVFRIFVNNSFPNFILKQQVSIRCLDLSLSRARLAIVDESNVLMVYDMISKQLLYQEPNATSVCWNQACEDMLCFSGNGCLNIKASNFPVHQMRQQGFVVGFNGAKIFCLNFMTISQVDVPQSVSMIQHLERKNYRGAYEIATLGVTEGDWKTLGIEALEGMDLEVAKKAFVRIKESHFLDLIHNFEERKRTGDTNLQLFLAEIYAYQGKFFEAAEVFKKCGAQQKAVEMFTELRDFELAKKFMTSSGKEASELIGMQADWAMTTNDPQAACNMYVAAGNYMKAVLIMGEHGWVERLSSIFHDIPKEEAEVLRQCAEFLKQLGQPLVAAEVYEKIEDHWAHISLYIDLKQWDMAFQLAKKHEEYLNEVYLPYAFWLMENDRYDEAQEAMCKAGKEDEALRMLEQLAANATKERRFGDTGYYYWLLAKSCLEAAANLAGEVDPDLVLGREKLMEKFHSSIELSECYHVYNVIHYFMEQPFTSYLPEALLNMSRYLTLKTLKHTPPGISKVFTLFTLAKQGKQLGAYKLARYAYDKLQSLHIPSSLQEAVDVGHLTIRSKPYMDKEDFLPMCYRCSTTNPLINTVGNRCVNCQQMFEISFVSFEVLPVVEFVLEDGISDEEAIKLINRDPAHSKFNGDWKESVTGNTNTLRLSDPEVNVKDPMTANSYEMSDKFVPVVYSRSHLVALHRMEVIIKRWGPPVGNQYYKSIMPDMHITLCPGCNKMFHADDYELQVLSKGHCPFCRRKSQAS